MVLEVFLGFSKVILMVFSSPRDALPKLRR